MNLEYEQANRAKHSRPNPPSAAEASFISDAETLNTAVRNQKEFSSAVKAEKV